MDENLLQRIAVNPEVMTGKPVIRGTRIPVELLVRMVAQGIPESDILREYPALEPEDIRAALTYAAYVLAHKEVFPPVRKRSLMALYRSLPATEPFPGPARIRREIRRRRGKALDREGIG